MVVVPGGTPRLHLPARWFQVLQVAGIGGSALFLLVLPFAHLTAVRSFGFSVALASAIALFAASPPRRIPLSSVFALWFAVAVLSLVSTVDVQASVDAILRDIVRSFFVFFVFYTLSVRVGALSLWVSASAMGIGVLSILALAVVHQHGHWGGYYVPLLGEFTTSATTLVPVLLGYLAWPGRDRRVCLVVLAATPLLFAAGHVTISRAFWVVSIFAVFSGWLLYVVRLRRWVWTPIVIVVCGAALVAAAEVMKRRGDALTYFEDRSPIVAAVTAKLLRNPVTGTGFGHQTDRAWYEAALPNTFIYHPHNIVLGFMDQMGMIGGAVALAAVFGAPVLAFLRYLRGTRRESTVAIAGLVVVASVFLRNNADFFFLKHNAWLFFAYVGIFLGQLHRGSKDANRANSGLESGTNGPHPR